MASSKAGQWFYEQGGAKYGPVTHADLKHLAKNGNVVPSTRIWTKGMSEWQPAEKVAPALFIKPKKRVVEETVDLGGDPPASGWAALGFVLFALVAAGILAAFGYFAYTKYRDSKQEVVKKQETPPDDANKQLSADQVAEAYEKSVALITCKFQVGNLLYSGWGTGFLVAPDVVCTNYHVIAKANMSDVEVSFPSSKQEATTRSLKARLLYEDPRRDLAFLKVSAATLPPLKLSGGQSRKGATIFAIGSPGTGTGSAKSVNQINSGQLSNPNWLDENSGLSFHIVSANINWGNSGGPVFDARGDVIGVAVQVTIGKDDGLRREGMNRAIPSEAVIEALRAIKDKTDHDILKAEHAHEVVAQEIRRANKS
jgi:S1-C subfamily serine protease